MTDAQRCARSGGGRSALGSAGTAFYGDLRLHPLLRGVMAHSGDLLGAAAGSVSLLDAARGRYTKVAERGSACRTGETFPMDEGVTGRVVSRRGPVVLRSYRELLTGHLPEGHPVGDGAVAAVPIWWRGDVVGVNVVFAGRPRRFSSAEVDELDVITQSAAAAIVTAAGQDGSDRSTVPDPSAPVGERGRPAVLTPREQEVLALLARGLGDRLVGRALGISVKTVEKHVGALLRKTGSANRTEAVVKALERGWLATDRRAG